jgi:hypothetical protein
MKMAVKHPDDGGSKHLCNVSKRLPDYMAQQSGRQPSTEIMFTVI